VVNKASEFRRNAEDSRQRAQHARNVYDRQHWIDVAAHWFKMALAEEMTDYPLMNAGTRKWPNSATRSDH
jgi:hypothetical protein